MAFFRSAYSILTALFLLVNPEISFAQENIKDEILDEINKIRVSGCMCGNDELPPAGKLTWSDQLEKAATRHATDMYKHDNLDHKGTDGSDLGDRATDAGYEWSMVGENIAWGHPTIKEAVEGWISSPEHCKNMMSPVFKDMGAARKGEYWVLQLGVKK
jgi:uncharacterized protein YkwD